MQTLVRLFFAQPAAPHQHALGALDLFSLFQRLPQRGRHIANSPMLPKAAHRHGDGHFEIDLLDGFDQAPEQGREQVTMAHRQNAAAHTFNTYLRSLLCDRLVVLNSALSIRKWFARRNSFRPESVGPRLRVHADRTLEISYPTDEALKSIRENRFRDYAGRYAKARRYKNMDEFREAIRDVADSVARIQHNGGKVVFLRLPATGARLQLEEATYPSALYFGVLAERTSAPWIDFRELSHENDLDCPDESHLSADSALVFTSRLVERLRRGSLLGQ